MDLAEGRLWACGDHPRAPGGPHMSGETAGQTQGAEASWPPSERLERRGQEPRIACSGQEQEAGGTLPQPGAEGVALCNCDLGRAAPGLGGTGPCVRAHICGACGGRSGGLMETLASEPQGARVQIPLEQPRVSSRQLPLRRGLSGAEEGPGRGAPSVPGARPALTSTTPRPCWPLRWEQRSQKWAVT